jgi:hypothetical protein
MPLLFDDSGHAFAIGVVGYRLVGGREPTHLTIEIDVAGQRTEAIIDTGAPYLICSPDLAEQLAVDPADALYPLEIMIRGIWVKGGLHRLPLVLLASEGNSLSMEATAFIPDAPRNFGTSHPSFVGYVGCLERVRFAIDPQMERFYFGPFPDTP